MGTRNPAKPRANRERPPSSGKGFQISDEALWLLDENDRDLELARMMMDLSDESALALIQQLQGGNDPGDVREEKLRALVRAWAKVHPDAAIEWARQLPEWQRPRTLENVCMDVASTSPLKALEAINALQISSEGIVENIAHTWASKDQAAAIQWAKELPDGEQRDQIFLRIASVQSESDPKKAVDLILAEIQPGTNQEEAAMTIVHQWALKDFAGAREWVNTFPLSPFRTRAFAELDGIAAARK